METKRFSVAVWLLGEDKREVGFLSLHAKTVQEAAGLAWQQQEARMEEDITDKGYVLEVWEEIDY